MSPIQKISQDQFLGLDFSYSKTTLILHLAAESTVRFHREGDVNFDNSVQRRAINGTSVWRFVAARTQPWWAAWETNRQSNYNVVLVSVLKFALKPSISSHSKPCMRHLFVLNVLCSKTKHLRHHVRRFKWLEILDLRLFKIDTKAPPQC